mgnify:CR=1 FL=1
MPARTRHGTTPNQRDSRAAGDGRGIRGMVGGMEDL